ncbi:MAG: glutamate-5-semialdehyde dehydrogenase [Arcanobacterium sp.]|nr:glutamate-5-semialdehyde dehydrogenase [Arcanobacterium sp.]
MATFLISRLAYAGITQCPVKVNNAWDALGFLINISCNAYSWVLFPKGGGMDQLTKASAATSAMPENGLAGSAKAEGTGGTLGSDVRTSSVHTDDVHTTSEGDVHTAVHTIATGAKRAARTLRSATAIQKNALLERIAEELENASAQIVAANALDMKAGRERGMAEGLLDRLLLTDERVTSIAGAVRHVAALPDPVGEVVEGRTLANGLRLKKVRVPMGVIGMIYEARPNVTVDGAVLALKAGSSAILRGGSAALHSNKELVNVIRRALTACDFPPELVSSIDDYGRGGAVELMHARGLVDLVIPRGGAGLIQTVVREATVPVIETGVGNVHIYVDKDADLDKAIPIVLNSKLQRVGVCNAAESLLVHKAVAEPFLAQLFSEFEREQVRVHADELAASYAPASLILLPATEDDWAREYLAREIAVKIVDDEEEAIEHILRYSSGHTEAIVSDNYGAIQDFIDAMDCAVVAVNASTRFTDGGEFGMGAEIGISTQKLHARGPMGLREITSTTWIVEGDGHVRC